MVFGLSSPRIFIGARSPETRHAHYSSLAAKVNSLFKAPIGLRGLRLPRNGLRKTEKFDIGGVTQLCPSGDFLIAGYQNRTGAFCLAPHKFCFAVRDTGIGPVLFAWSRTILLSTMRVAGIEPASQAWEACIIPLDHTRKIQRDCDLYLKILRRLEFLDKSGRSKCTATILISQNLTGLSRTYPE